MIYHISIVVKLKCLWSKPGHNVRWMVIQIAYIFNYANNITTHLQNEANQLCSIRKDMCNTSNKINHSIWNWIIPCHCDGLMFLLTLPYCNEMSAHGATSIHSTVPSASKDPIPTHTQSNPSFVVNCPQLAHFTSYIRFRWRLPLTKVHLLHIRWH